MHKSRVLLKQDKCLVLQPEIVRIIGRSPALLLQQIHYWVSSENNLGRFFEGRKWVYNTYEGWVNELKTLSKSTINRSLAKLKAFGVISIEKLNKRRGDQTNWYTINYDKLSQLLNSIYPTELTESADNLNPVERFKMSESSTQNESMYIDTNNTNKDLLNNHNSSVSSDGSKINKYQNHPVSRQMLTIWNQEIKPDVESKLTQHRSRMLMAAFKQKFDQSLEKWKVYCQQIATSDYLMGKVKSSFKATIDWVLKFDIIQRIRECQFGIKPLVNENCVDQTIKNDIAIEDIPAEEKDLKMRIIQILGPTTYQSWLKSCYITLQENSLIIKTTSTFCRDWIQSHFVLDLENGLSKRVIIS